MADLTDGAIQRDTTNSRCCRCSQVLRLITVEPVIFLYFFATMPGFTVFEQFVYKKVGEKYNLSQSQNGSECFENVTDPVFLLQQKVQSEASKWMILFSTAMIFPSCVATIVLGSYGDKRGRKIGFIVPVIGGLLKSGISLITIYFDLPVTILFIGVILEGCSGGISTMLANAFAYIADISLPEDRPLRYVTLELCLGIGSTTSLLMVGFLIKWGFFYPFIVMFGVYVVLLIYIPLIVKETVNSAEHPDRKLFTLSHFVNAFSPFLKQHHTNRRWKMQLLLAILILWCMTDLGTFNIQTYTLLNSPLCFTSIKIGLYQATMFLMRGIGAFLGVKLFKKCLPEAGIMLIGCSSGLGLFVMFALVKKTFEVFLIPLVGIFSLTVVPLIRSTTSKLAEPHELGAVFATIAWTQMLAALLGTVSFDAIYSVLVDHLLPGSFTFMVGAGLIAVAAMLTLTLICKSRSEEPQSTTTRKDESTEHLIAT